jgi:hypothetical protein
VPLSGPAVLRDGANMLSVVLQPAAAAAARAKLAYPYLVPTMQVRVCLYTTTELGMQLVLFPGPH